MTDAPLPYNPLDDTLPKQSLASEATSACEEFKPWHLPRKHYTRNEQWGTAVNNLLNELPTGNDLVNYLCLPGEDLLDVEVLATTAKSKNWRLRYFGFDNACGRPNARTSPQRAAAEQRLKQMGTVSDDSWVESNNFASIVSERSTAWKKILNLGHFDVVNLDFCDAFTSSTGSHNHQALQKLLDHQCHFRGYPWLLFLTTKSTLSSLPENERETYRQLIKTNADSDGNFRSLVCGMLGVTTERPAGEMDDPLMGNLINNTEVAGKWLSLAIGKWLLRILSGQKAWRVDLLSLHCCRTGLHDPRAEEFARQPPNLFSLAFRFNKIRRPHADPSHLATNVPADGDFNEIKLARKMAHCICSHTKDLDCLMQSNPDLHQTTANECKELLKVRHYSETAYSSWIGRLPRVDCSATEVAPAGPGTVE